MQLPLYMDINRPEGLAQQIVTLIQFVDRYYPQYVEIIREIIREYVPVDLQLEYFRQITWVYPSEKPNKMNNWKPDIFPVWWINLESVYALPGFFVEDTDFVIVSEIQ